MAEELQGLKAKRGQIKGKLTRYKKQFDKLDKENLNSKLVSELEIRLEKVSPIWDEFHEIQEQIELIEQDVDDDEADNFESSYFDLVGSMQGLCRDVGNNDTAGSSGSVANVSAHSSGSHADNLQSLVKLPPIKLPTFNGHYDTWLEFKDSFLALVHSNTALTDIQRFYYLRSSLEKDAQQIIKSIEVSSANYTIAWQMLEERFENKKLIIHNHLKAIFEYPAIAKESHLELRNLYDNVTKHLRSLNSLGLQTDTWDCIVIYIICNKLDSVTRREWEGFKYQQELPTIQDLNSFLKEKCEMLEKLEVSSCQDKTNKGKFRYSGFSGSRSFAVTDSRLKCYFCQKDHPIYKCESFLKLNVDDRLSSVKKLKLCLNCLRDSHPTWKCKMQKCLKCHKLHNSLLHLNYLNSEFSSIQSTAGGNNSQQSNQDGTGEDDVSTSLSNHVRRTADSVAKWADDSQILLSTVRVRVINGNKSVICRALLDSGSQSNFVTEELCKSLNLECSKINHVIKGVGEALAKINNETKLTIKSCYGNYSNDIKCLVIPRITGNLPIKSFSRQLLEIPPDLPLADPNFYLSDDIDLLLGSSVFWTVLTSGRKNMGSRMPVLQNTEFGWVVAGNLYLNSLDKKESITCLNLNTSAEPIDSNIVKFWELEEVGSTNKILSKEEIYCEEYFKNTVSKDSSGRYIIKIPFKDSIEELGDSHTMALHRFDLLEKRLSKNPDLKKQYTEFMSEYLELGHMSETDIDDYEGYFLPHHAIVKQSSLTTKCRVVFDGSAKSSSGLSINDVQYIGPTLQQDIFMILVRFRSYTYVLSSDISKMYRQVLIHQEQRKFQKILWRSEPDKDLKCYELNTITYGTASAPYLAVRSLFQAAEDNEINHPLIAKIIKRDFYMDDLLTGSDNEGEILKIQKDISEVLSRSGFELRKWLCNNQEIMKQFTINRDLDVSILEIGNQNKTLGIIWDAKNDVIRYNINVQPHQWSKRSILSVICQVYDPLGLLGPLVINAKLVMQDLWKRKLEWDQDLPSDILQNWLRFYNNIMDINKMAIPRHAKLSCYISIELHGFSDASMKAYGCCIYLRCSMSTGKYVSHLLCAKSRVAPLKLVSLPRLELCGAVLLANLANRVTSSLEISFNDKYFWTDSTICLCWIKEDPSKWKQFVANRVQEIQNLSSPMMWNHVDTGHNPADLLSRGCSANDLIDNQLWWHGPEWLLKGKDHWNISQDESPLEIPESKTISCITINNDNLINELLNRFSSFITFLHVLGYILRFIFNSRVDVSKRKFGILQFNEIEDALVFAIKIVQRECFSSEYNSLLNNKSMSNKSKILSLNPFMHNDLLRVGGRLKNSNIPFNCKHQIILPSNHLLTKRILQNEHERLLHCGVQQLMYSIRQKYWPISARNACKYVVKKCIPCFRAKPKLTNYLMGDLPDVRVNGFSVFENVGTDYGGPFLAKDRKSRGAKVTKVYICLFICMTTKAVHIELVSDITTDAFIAALKRFISRRGRPSNIYSDNGSNYVGANNELHRLYKFLQDNHDLLSQNMLSEKIKWHFIPANSPTFGGLWEAGIKSIKSHLKRILGLRTLTFEEFGTLLAQVEGILNSRPLCPMSNDPDDSTALTPAHFLIGRTLTMLPEVDLSAVPENRLDRWQKIQALVQQLWSRWKKEYLNELQVRQKWKLNSYQLLKVGSMVLVKDDRNPPLQWPLGRVTCLHPGPDGVLRVVTVKVRGNEIKRAVNRLCVLPLDDD